MQRTISAFALALALAFPTAHAAGGGTACPFSGLQQVDVGVGTGFLQPSQLQLALDAATCAVTVDVDAPVCCNVLVTQHFLVLGGSVDPVGTPLGAPFLSGSLLHVAPILQVFAAPGVQSSVALPANPALIGVPLPLQAGVEFFTTIGLTFDYGVTQAAVVTLQ